MDSPLAAAILGASAVASFAAGLWLPSLEAERRVKRRLASFVEAPIGGFAAHAATVRRQITREARASGRDWFLIRQLERFLTRVDSDVDPLQLTLSSLAVGALFAALTFALTREPLLELAAVAVGGSAPFLWLRWLHQRTIATFQRQLPETVALLAGSVRSGHSLLQALELVASEAPEPTKSAFQLAVWEIGLGAAQEDALERLAARYPSDDLQLIVTSVNVQHQIGGSLARVLDSISETIRERMRIEGDIRALTAPQRASAYILSGLPVFITIGLALVGGDYIAALFQPGPLRIALLVAMALVSLGFLVMRSMAKIDV